MADTETELRRLGEAGVASDCLVWTWYRFSHFLSEPDERRAFLQALIAAGFTGVGTDEELTGDEYWHHYSHTIRPADPNVLTLADSQASKIAQEHGVQYDGWEVLRDHRSGAIRTGTEDDISELTAMNSTWS